MFILISVKDKLELIKRGNEFNESIKQDNNNGNNCIDDIERAIQDYDNIIITCLKYLRYFVFYKLNDNKYIYTNNISDIDNNYAINGNGDIDQFIEESSKHVDQNKHHGSMFFISSHCDRDKVIHDGECEIYKLDSIFSMYSSHAHQSLGG